MKLAIQSLLLATVFAFSTFAFADNASNPSLSHAEQTQLLQDSAADNDAKDEACKLAGGGDRCPACCTGCGTPKEDCSGCNPKPSKVQS